MKDNFRRVSDDFAHDDYSSQVWYDWENNSDEDCPGRGLIALRPWEGDDDKKTQHKANSDNEDSIVLDGTKPTNYTASEQNHALLAVNSDAWVDAGKRGQCTLAYPALVYVDDEHGELRSGDLCGPTNDSWAISKYGEAFVFLGHEPLDLSGSDVGKVPDSILTKYHYGWVAINHQVRNANTVKFRNDTYEDLTRGDVVELNGVVNAGLTSGEFYFKGIKPTAAARHYGVLLSDVDSTKTGRVQVSGIVRAKVDQIYATHPFAHTTSGDNQLQTDWHGQCEILDMEEIPHR